MQEKQAAQHASPKKSNKPLVVGLCVLLAACLCVIGYLVWQNSRQPQETGGLKYEENQLEGQLQGKTKEEMQEELDRRVAENMFNISINTEPIFENGKSEGNLRIENSQANHYLMVVKIVLKDGEEQVYESGAIKPGNCLETAKLDVPLEKGEYPAVAYFEAYNPDTQGLVGRAAAELTLKIQN